MRRGGRRRGRGRTAQRFRSHERLKFPLILDSVSIRCPGSGGTSIALVDSSGKTVTAVARELGISSESLRGWYRKAKADRGEGTPGELSSAEREEIKRLRRENREQQQTIEILKKATAFFVKENDR
ncbi:transposase [Streptomyces mirabilis]|uniref:transposase n=1 Tax=Streptomyces mirabilis TaxID=68239 RepID=UPI0036AD37DE